MASGGVAVLTMTADAETVAYAEPLLAMDRVSLTIKGQPVLRDISFPMAPTGVTVLVGPSGSGKSSLLRVLNRLWDHTPGAKVTGTVRFQGVNLYGRGVDPIWVRSQIGMVFQRPTPFPRSIADNIALPLKVHGIPAREIPARVEEALRLAALWDEVKDRLTAPALTLSGGQQQRLCIARALAVRPRVLLMDEPASALDPRSREAIARLVETLGQHLAVVLVTHSLEEARRLGKQVGVLIAGRLEAFGPTDDVFLNPKSPAARAYLLGSDV
jgi:phosphate transport system ATP-binding protein